MYRDGRYVHLNFAEAVRWFQAAADKGFGPAQNCLACRYRYGQGVKRDYAEALRWFKSAAEKNDADAEYNLFCMYDEGQGTSVDKQTAQLWLRRAHQHGHDGSIEFLGTENRDKLRLIGERGGLPPGETRNARAAFVAASCRLVRRTSTLFYYMRTRRRGHAFTKFACSPSNPPFLQRSCAPECVAS